jgi:hypothetical protein
MCEEGAMALTSLPIEDGGHDRVLQFAHDLRPDDSMPIAAERLDRTLEEPIEEPQAVASPEEEGAAGPPLVDRIASVEPAVTVEPAVAEAQPEDAGEPAEAPTPPADPEPEVALAENPESLQPIPKADATPLDTEEVVETLPPAPFPALPVETTAEPPPFAPVLAQPVVVELRPVAHAPVEAFSASLSETLYPSSDAPPPDPVPASAPMETGQPKNVTSLANALDSAAKLAADANAAAVALEDLRRLLERGLPNAATHPALAPAARKAKTAMLHEVAAAPPPLPAALPLHAVRSANGGVPTLRKAVLPRPTRMPPERRRLDVRGFMAGFALSWAFGVVLYLFLTAG